MVDEIVVGFEDPRVLKAGEPEARLWSSLPNREPVAHQNPGAMVSAPTLRASWVRHVESDSPPSGNRPRVTISGTRYNLHVYARRVVHAAVRGRAGSGAIMADTVRQVHPDARTGQRGRYWRPFIGGQADQEMGPADRDREPTRWRRHPGDQRLRQRPG